MSHDRRKTAMVGLFVTAGVGIAIAALTAVSSLSTLFDSRAVVTADFPTVDGLSPGDAVWFSGVPVGQVKEVSLAEGSKVRVTMAIREDQAQYIPADVLATMSTDGLIGNAIVVLGEGNPSAGPLQDGSELSVTQAVSAEQLMDEFAATNRQLQEVVANLAEVTRPVAEGEGTVGKLLTDDELYNELLVAVGDLRSAAASANVTTSNVATFTDKLNRPGSLPNQLVTDTTTYATLVDGVGSLKGAADNIEATSQDVRVAAGNTDTPLGVLMHDKSAGGDLEATLDHMNTSSVLLSENLEAMQRSFLMKPLFKSKKKQEEAKQERLEQARQQADRDRDIAIADADGE